MLGFKGYGKNAKHLMFIGGAAALLVAAYQYFALRREQSGLSGFNDRQKRLIGNLSTSVKNLQKSEDISVQSSLAWVTELYSLVSDCIQEDYEQLLVNHRLERRRFLGVDQIRYEESIIKFDTSLRSKIKSSMQQILAEINMDLDYFVISCNKLLDKKAMPDSIHLVCSMMQLPVTEIRRRDDRYSGMIDFIRQEIRGYQVFTKSHIQLVKKSMIYDRIHEEYELEEEDLQACSDRATNEDIMKAKRYVDELLSKDSLPIDIIFQFL